MSSQSAQMWQKCYQAGYHYNLQIWMRRYGVSWLTVRTSSALLLRILVDGKDFVDVAS